jgi:[ribosomal protein S5]-alanine N-acetyltransferase
MKNADIFSSFPIIKLSDITLREISDDDVENYYYYMINPNVKKFLAEEEILLSVAHAHRELNYWKNLFRYKHCFFWAIVENETNKLIGTCGFNNWNLTHKRAEISYDLNYNYWGKGIMTRSLDEICNFAFEKMQVNRVQATVAHDNFASIRVLEKLGFSQEGFMKKFAVLHGIPTDYYMFGKTKD